MRIDRTILGVVLGAVMVGCGSSSGGDVPSGDGGGDDARTDSATGGDGAIPSDTGSEVTAGTRTLATCETSIATDAPAFFSKYFKCVTITTTPDSVIIASRALPPHLTYYYGAGDPNYAPFDTSRGSEYMPNPNKLKEKALKITVPKNPTAKGITITAAMVDGVVGTSTEEYSLGPVGIALDSVAVFNPLAAPGDDIEKEKFTFDDFNAHPAPDGTYHYHTTSKGPLEVLTMIGATSGVELYGMMCDGTVVMGCTELDGSSPDLTALDAQGGHMGDVKDAAGTVHFAARYHVHVCPAKGGRKFTPEIRYYSTCTK